MNIIEAKDLSFKYDEASSHLILDNINLNIEKGSFTAIIGHNGSGKSTFAKHLNAILLPCGGSVYVCGINTQEKKSIFELRKSAGMVFQNPDNQIVATIVEEDVAFGLENIGVQHEEMCERVEKALKAVDMYEYKNHAPHLLSGGQKQRVAIAGILAMEPQCIVLDEPTAMLDPVGRKEVLNTIVKLNREKNITIVLITHYMDEAVKADRVVIMNKGSVVMDSTPDKVFEDEAKLSELGLGVPQSTALSHRLKACGLNVGSALTPEECAEEILKMAEGIKND